MDLGIAGISDAEQVGAGGAGVVYRARQAEFDRDVAVKVFPADEDPRRVERERLAIGPLSDHAGIVPVYDAGVTRDGRPYLLMAFMPGGSLADVVRRDGALTAGRTAEIGAAVTRAVAEAHGRGIRHRDIKPQNILLDRFGHPRLADFGIAHLADGAFRTGTDSVSGTVSYMAPEVILGQEGADTADVYSLGATLYFAAEGRHLVAPRTGETYEALVHRRVTAAPEVTFTARTPAWLQAVLRRALAAAPEDRFPSASAFADALQAGAAGAPAEAPTDRIARRPADVAAVPSPWVERGAGGRDPEPVWTTSPAVARPPRPAPLPPLPPPRRRGPRTVLAAIALALVLAGGGTAIALSSQRPAPGANVAADVPFIGRAENRPTAERYRNAAKADPQEVLKNVASFRSSTGQDDPEVAYVELVFWERDLPPGGRGTFEFAEAGADRATATYELVEGDAHERPVGDVGSARKLFRLSSVPWSRIPQLMRRTRAACQKTPGPFDVSTVSAVVDPYDGRTRVQVSVIDLATGGAGYVQFDTGGVLHASHTECWIS